MTHRTFGARLLLRQGPPPPSGDRTRHLSPHLLSPRRSHVDPRRTEKRRTSNLGTRTRRAGGAEWGRKGCVPDSKDDKHERVPAKPKPKGRPPNVTFSGRSAVGYFGHVAPDRDRDSVSVNKRRRKGKIWLMNRDRSSGEKLFKKGRDGGFIGERYFGFLGRYTHSKGGGVV